MDTGWSAHTLENQLFVTIYSMHPPIKKAGNTVPALFIAISDALPGIRPFLADSRSNWTIVPWTGIGH